MSNYMNYLEASKIYDDARVPADVDTMYSILTGLLKMDSSQINLLDIGCGTGNYSLGFLKNGLGSITMIDASEGMLERAKEKTLEFKEKVTIKQAFLPALGFPSNSFDVLTCIQVLHHIDSVALKNTTKEDLQAADYPNMLETLRKAYDVLRPGGILLLDVMFEENCDSFWWTSLCPIAAKKFKQLRMKREDMIRVLKEINFENIFCTYFPGSCLVKKDIYDQIEQIDDPKWRYYLSQYKLVEQSGELDNLIKSVKDAKESGSLNQFYDNLCCKLRTHGNHTAVFAMKPLV